MSLPIAPMVLCLTKTMTLVWWIAPTIVLSTLPALKALGLALGLVLFTGLPAFAQSLIVGIPNADTTPPGEILLTHESQFSPQKPTDWWNSFTFGTYGVSKHLELSVSLNNLRAPKTDNLSLLAGYKHVYPIAPERFPKAELKLTHGAFVPISLQGKGTGYWAFAHASARHPKTKTRVTAGISTGTRQVFGQDSISAMVGVEQPITKKWSVVADWYSGAHDLAALIPAVQYNVNPRGDIIIMGAKIPNDFRRSGLAFIVEFTKRVR